jgi:hypothetical protein
MKFNFGVKLAPIAIFFLTACATHEGNFSSGPTPSENHNLVDIAIVTSSSSQFLFFGGLKKDGLVMEAKRNLYTLYPPKKGRIYANVSVDLKKENYLQIVKKEKIYITADIYDLNVPEDKEANDRFIGSKPLSAQNINLNEFVYIFEDDSLKKVQVLQFFEKNLLIKYQKSNGELEITRIGKDEIIKKENIISKPKKISEQISFKHRDVEIKSQSIFEGNIIAMSEKGYVIEYIINKKSKIVYKKASDIL